MLKLKQQSLSTYYAAYSFQRRLILLGRFSPTVSFLNVTKNSTFLLEIFPLARDEMCYNVEAIQTQIGGLHYG